MSLWFIYLLVCVFFLIYIKKMLWDKRQFHILSWQLPGPLCLPFLGNALTFLGRNEDFLDCAFDLCKRYKSPFRFWLGPKCLLVISEPNQLQVVFTSAKYSAKDDLYNIMSEVAGEGLVTSSGSKWKVERHLMNPIFLKKNISLYFPSILMHVNNLTEALGDNINKSYFNIDMYMHRCCSAILAEFLLDVKFDTTNNESLNILIEYLCQYKQLLYTLMHARMLKIWLQFDWIFRFTRYYNIQKKGKENVQKFIKSAIQSAKNNKNDRQFKSVVHHLLDIVKDNPKFATEQEIIDHLVTLFAAGEDTTSSISSFCILMLGMYPQVQQKCYEEIILILGEKRNIEMKDVTKLEYLKCCIDECIRLFPIGPFMLRKSSGDGFIDKWFIPKDCSIVIPAYYNHRNPKYWDYPNEFYPEHFSPENIEKRPRYVYLPFSSGLRSCIGRQFALVVITTILATILRKYKIEADGKLKDLTILTDISVRIKDNNFPIKLKDRFVIE